MVVGVHGDDAVSLVIQEYRQEHAQILHQQMEVLSVPDLQVEGVTQKDVQVIDCCLDSVITNK